MTDLEGRSRRNNIRIYGIHEDAEGTSAVTFIENFIKTELGNELIAGLGIECTHHAMAPKPPPSSPPHSMVVHFLQFYVKEKILHAAWKKKNSVSKINGCILVMTMQRRCRTKGRNIYPSRKYYRIMAYVSRLH